MKMFVWENVGNLTGNYHDGGGVVVIAADLEDARKQIKGACEKGCTALKDAPDFTANVEADEGKCFVFPDAGSGW